MLRVSDIQKTVTHPARLAVLVALGLSGPALAQTNPITAAIQAETTHADPGLYPAAQCAALWFGQDDYAAVSRLMEPVPGSLQLADGFRAVALRQSTQGQAGVDQFIAQQRPMMTFLVESYVFGGDEQSRKFYEKLMADCDAFAATQPETRPLR